MKWRGDTRTVGNQSGFDGFHSTTAPAPVLRPAVPVIPAAVEQETQAQRVARLVPGRHGMAVSTVGRRARGRHQCTDASHPHGRDHYILHLENS